MYKRQNYLCINVTAHSWAGTGFGGSGSFGKGRYYYCTSSSNGQYGFWEGNGGAHWIGCTAKGNAEWGFLADGGNPNTWIGCTAENNVSGGGIGQSEAGGSVIVGNRCHDNTGQGISVGGDAFEGTNTTISGNHSSENSSDGIYMGFGFGTGGSYSGISGNVVIDNGGWGIEVSDAENVHVSGNTLNNNTGGCIDLGVVGQGNSAVANNCAATGGIGAGGGAAGADATAIHDNVAAEISAIAAKAVPVLADLILIEDSEDSFNKKKITVGDLALVIAAQTGDRFIGLELEQQLATGIDPTVTGGA